VLRWTVVLTLLDRERVALDEFCAEVRARFGVRLRELALFGSRARGEEASDDSDVDVLVVIDGMTGAEGRAVAHLAGDAMTRHDILLSPFVVSAERTNELRARERLIASEIARDAVPL
jgi:predicted nucleotidyltransferase